MAVEQANAAGGYRGLRFRLAPAWSENPWGSGISQVTRLVYNDRVWALIGGIDGVSTHLAEQVTAKARLALVSPVSSDKTVNYAYVPWAFSISASDSQQAGALIPLLEPSAKSGKLVILSANDHDSKMAVRELQSLLGRKGLSPSLHIEFERGAPETAGPVEEVRAAKADSVCLIADSADSARMIAALRAGGCGARIFGTFAMARRDFLEKAGAAAEGAIFAVSGAALDSSSDFAREFRRRAGQAPDYAAVQMYDATRLLLHAIRKAGLNRALIRDALRDSSGWEGLSGVASWDPVAQNRATVRLATVKNGALVSLP
jgi:branched-chain amino acid transport system substrate-binding protein